MRDGQMPAAALTLTDGIGPVQTPQTAPTITQLALCCKNFFRCAGRDCSALRRTISFMGGGAPKKAAGKNEKYKNTQLAAAVLEIKEP